MSLPARYSESLPSIADAQTIRCVVTPTEADAVAAFLLQPNLFGTPLTPGEREDFQHAPHVTLTREDLIFWYIPDGPRTVAATVGIRHNVNRTGIYQIIAFAVHQNHRHRGFGRNLLNHALDYIREIKGRGLLFDTSAHESYLPMQHLLLAMQFLLVGRFPDFYYPGEDTLWYYRAVEPRP
nr:GNAT family N-acetyltransferase [uncultured Desulfobulbus sp.]